MKSTDLAESTPFPKRGRVSSARAFVDTLMRSRASLAAPPSTGIPSGNGVKSVLAPHRADCPRARKEKLEEDEIESPCECPGRKRWLVPCSDDSGAHNSAHRADERMRDHSAMLIIWNALGDDNPEMSEAERVATVHERKERCELRQRILTMQHTPVQCTGAGRKPEDRSAENDVRHFCCPDCGRPQTGKLKLESGRYVVIDASTNGLAEDGRVKQHIRCVPVIQERHSGYWWAGDGSELIRYVDGKYPREFERRRVWQPVTVSHEQIAEAVGLSASQVRRHITAANKAIARQLADANKRDAVEALTRLLREVEA